MALFITNKSCTTLRHWNWSDWGKESTSVVEVNLSV